MFVLKYKYHITSGVSETWFESCFCPLDLTSLYLFLTYSHSGVIDHEAEGRRD